MAETLAQRIRHRLTPSVILRKFHWRRRNFNDQTSYHLPSDGEEHSRLDSQHDVLKMARKSLYSCPELVQYALSSAENGSPMILDIGTGSGRWALDMAEEFPKAQVVGSDLQPPACIAGGAKHRGNCRFEVRNGNDLMPEYYNKVDVFHARAIEPGIKDYDLFMYEAARCLRPNGVLLIGTGCPQMLGEDQKPVPLVEEGRPGFSWMQTILGHAYLACRRLNNRSVDGPLYWEQWLKENPNYCDVRLEYLLIPVGPWQSGMSEEQTLTSELLRNNMIHVSRNFRPLLISAGYEPQRVDRMIENTTKEARQSSVRTYMRWQFVTAIRNDAPWQPRQGPAPVMDPSASVISSFTIDMLTMKKT